MGIASLIGTRIGRVSGGKFGGYNIVLGSNKKFAISRSSNIYNQIIFTKLLCSDVKIPISDLKSFKVVSENFRQSIISLIWKDGTTTIEVPNINGGRNLANLISVIENNIIKD